MSKDKYDRRRNLDRYVSPAERLKQRSKKSDRSEMIKGYALYLSMFLIIMGPIAYVILSDYFKFMEDNKPSKPATTTAPSKPIKFHGPSNIEPENCTNGIDDDGDGDIDCADSNCAVHITCNPVEICSDGVDNDGDGLVDCTDSDCEYYVLCQVNIATPAMKLPNPSPTEICNDGVDNNNDGLIDCKDIGCLNHPHCSYNPKKTLQMQKLKKPSPMK